MAETSSNASAAARYAAKKAAAGESTVLESLGFTRGDLPDPRRVIASIEGLEKCGKTHLAMSAPAPIVYFDIDIGGQEVFKKFKQAGKAIYPEQFSLPRMAIDNKAEVKAQAMPVWKRFVDLYFKALESSKKPGGARTIILDTATDFWSLCLLSHLGKDKQIMPQERTQANAAFSDVVRRAFAYDANVLLLHKMGKEFDNPTNLERKGFNQIGFLVQTVIVCRKDKVRDPKDVKRKVSKFTYTVDVCRQNTNLEGEVFDSMGGKFLFPHLMTDIVEDSELEDWK